ncbi:MAG: SCO family protein [Leptolyngbya sp. PLA3]|nr:MAG: SCO family protein [Cyanobacteria bacterium CYA]MCE7969678.1 SCO family protein [Leptolyngbya sp. PL-A3]
MPRTVAIVTKLAVSAVVAASVATGVMLVLAPSRVQSTGPAAAASLSPGEDTIIPGQPAAVLSGMKIRPFRLIDQDGKVVDETIFDGKWSIIDFFFTRCPGPCPTMTTEMRRIQQELAGTGVQFISFSVDAEYDAPGVLRSYAESHDADLSNWTFITGDPAQIEAMMTEGLGFAFERDGSAPVTLSNGEQGDNILHPTHLVLIAPDRRVLALAAVGNHEHIQLLVEGVRRLAK